ncbi:MAG: AAA family ATPase, partial [Chitinivibrionales bacterium]|nr:AAA family ATPase [Chitinivibrionales bacterium]
MPRVVLQAPILAAFRWRESMETLVAGLNEQQRKAVTAPVDRPVLVLAGAGCGKTTVLVRRIAWLLQLEYRPDSILALTFTRKAAGEMKERVSALRGESKGTAPLVTTFHGLGHRILHETIADAPNYTRLGFACAPDLLGERERLELLAAVTERRERQCLGLDLLRLDSLLEKTMVRPEAASGFDSGRRELLERIRARMYRRCRENNKWTFADMMVGTLELFDRCSDVARYYAERFDVLLVDEFQDTSPVQIRLLHSLFGPRKHLFAVGDDDQAIYGFRGADTGPILHFSSHFPRAQVVKLEVNYRSTPAILKAANRIFRDKPKGYRKTLRAGCAETPGMRPSVRRFASQAAMLQWVLRTVRGLVAGGLESEQIALLFRLNESLHWAREYVERAWPNGPEPRLMTIHGSKGLEFAVVFLCDLEEGFLPNYRLG